jgi:uncharacterized delta-60 repeat protein
MKKQICLLLVVLSTIVYSQVTQQWVRRYNSPVNDYDYARSIAVDGSGNVYVTGESHSSPTNGDYFTIKYNSSGVQQWAQRVNGIGNAEDIAYSIAVNNSGESCVTGTIITTTYRDFCTIKYNPNGSAAFFQTYNGTANSQDESYSGTIDNSGNVYVTGYCINSGTGPDYCTIKYSPSGSQLWVRIYNGPAGDDDFAYSIAIDISGNVYVTGRSVGNYADFCTIKYNSSGVQQWVKRYNGTGNYADVANAIALDISGNVYVTGFSWGTNMDYCTIKYNSSGVQQWVRIYNGPGNSDDEALSIGVDNSGNVYVTGYSTSSGTSHDYCTIKYSSTGVQQWVRRYNSPLNNKDEARSIAIDNSGNIYITGYITASGTERNYCTIKYNTAGTQQWVMSYNGPGNGADEATSIAVDNSGNTYVTGGSTGNGTDFDFCTIKYHEPIGIKQISSEIPVSYVLSQNFPNPFNPTTKIKFAIPQSPLYERGVGGFITLKVFDLLGREIATLVNQPLQPGTYEVEWDGTNYPSGVYFYRLTTSAYVEMKKMVLLK